MEMKETYIAPEVELLCFEPVENIATEFSLWSNGNGLTPGQDGSNTEVEGTFAPTEGGPTVDPDGEW